jgi:transposase-like protein
VVDTSRPIADVARELGINETSLGNWVRAYREKHAGDVSIHVSAGTVVAHPGHQIAQARARVGHELVAGVA